MKRIVSALDKLGCGERTCAIFVLCTTMTISLPAQTLTTLSRFDDTHGASPNAGLVQATNGDLYGMTPGGGANGRGTFFKITPTGELTTLYSFCSQVECTDGSDPWVGLIQAINGDLYGTAVGGPNGEGTVFKITPSGTLTTLYNFCAQSGCPDGYGPSGLVQATNGSLYGTTQKGGANGFGTVFKMAPTGALTTLYSFCAKSECADGAIPTAGLVQASNGDFYGTTSYGGASACTGFNPGCGAVFKITPSGALTTLYSFCAEGGACWDGAFPDAALVEATNGDLYGTTPSGGAHGLGTVFKITPGGALTTLYSFCSQYGCTDGSSPRSGLVQATNGDLYGTTITGGAEASCYAGLGCGTVFQITPSGALTTIYSFCSQSGCTDGDAPVAALVQDTNGDLYGTASSGGTSDACNNGLPGCGTVFSVSFGLGPFVETRPAAGEAGSFVEILGSDLTNATSVTFNGIAATFTVVSRYLITTTVPAGASTGKVEVVTPSGTLSNNVAFRVP
jgi:uncharacterized repeat protein (TIGR03803 family)